MSKLTVKDLLSGINTASASSIVNALKSANQREFESILMSLEWSGKLYKLMKLVSEAAFSGAFDEKQLERIHSRFCRLRYRHEQELLAEGKWYSNP